MRIQQPIGLYSGLARPRFGEDPPKPSKPKDLPPAEPKPSAAPPDFKQRFKKWVQDGMPLTKIDEKNKRSLPKQLWFGTKLAFGTIALTWSSVFLGGTGYNAVVGDGTIPDMAPLNQEAKPILLKNSTQAFFMNMRKPNAPTVTPQEVYEALKPTTLAHLKALNPQVHQWVTERFDHGKVGFEIKSDTALAEHDPYSDKLILYGDFMGLPDGEKVGILCHEYRHSRQNWGKRLQHLSNPLTLKQIYSEMLSPKSVPLGLGEDSYGNILEDDAHLYELEAYKKMGIRPRYEVTEYLKNRKLLSKDESH